VSPILVRPVREQFEHDRVIRVLQLRYKRKYEVAINPGAEQNASVGIGDLPMYPDLLLYSQDRAHKLQATIEVETTESINTLEAMAEWGPFSRLKTPFFLYVPPNAIDTVRRLCAEHQVEAAEIWTYHTAVDQVRFTMVHRAQEIAAALAKAKPAPKTEPKAAVKAEAKVSPPKGDGRPVPKVEARSVAKPAPPRPEKTKAAAHTEARSGPNRNGKAAKKPAAPVKKAVKAAKAVAKPAGKAGAKKPAKAVKRR
jgi:hypothetical protein